MIIAESDIRQIDILSLFCFVFFLLARTTTEQNQFLLFTVKDFQNITNSRETLFNMKKAILVNLVHQGAFIILNPIFLKSPPIIFFSRLLITFLGATEFVTMIKG